MILEVCIVCCGKRNLTTAFLGRIKYIPASSSSAAFFPKVIKWRSNQMEFYFIWSEGHMHVYKCYCLKNILHLSSG